MSNIILCTDFSDSSRNALKYTCELTYAGKVNLRLLHVYTIPVNYSGDGVSLSTLNDAFDSVEEQLRTERMWVKENYPEIHVATKAVTAGSFIDGILDEIAEEYADAVVIGAAKDYSDLWLWDSDTLKALIELPVPVLMIPPSITYRPLHKLAFACDMRHIGTHTPVEEIKRFASLTNARLHIINVINKEAEGYNSDAQQAMLQDMLKDLHPEFHQLKADNVISAISNFVTEQQIDSLMLIPRRHGIWDSLLHKSHTKELAKLNRIPILGMHEH